MGKSTDEVIPGRPQQTDVIQEEIRLTEAKISDTLHSIEDKFRPAHIRQELKERVKHSSAVGIARATETIRRRPAVAAAIGAGVLFFLIGKRRRHRRRQVSLAIEAMPKEMRKDPIKTIRKYITIGRMAVIIGSAISTVILRERRARQERQTEPLEAAVPRTGYGVRIYPPAPAPGGTTVERGGL